MSKLYGFKPVSSTEKIIDEFENNIVIRYNNEMLLETVYVDLQ